MSKYSTPYYNGSVYVNGENKSSSYNNDGNIVTNYNMSDVEKKLFDYSQESFLEALPEVNIFDDDVKKQFGEQLSAYAQKGLDFVDSTYSPMIADTMNDVARRFGNLDNSAFLNDLQDIESNRADAMSDLAQDVLIRQDELVNDELSRRYQYLAFLSDIYNGVTSSVFDYIDAASTNSNSGNSYSAQQQANQLAYANMIMNSISSRYS